MTTEPREPASSVESEPGVGSSSTLYLPTTDEVLSASGPDPVREGPLGRETVLVIEDEPTVRTLAATVLVRHGYRVLVAETPRAALAITADRTESIDLILSDVVLPDMLGPALIAQWRTQAAGPFRVIYMSRYASDKRGDPLAVGAEPFLAKPFKQTERLRADPPARSRLIP